MANNVGASAFSISKCRHHPTAATPKLVRSLSATVEFPASLKNRPYCASLVWAGTWGCFGLGRDRRTKVNAMDSALVSDESNRDQNKNHDENDALFAFGEFKNPE